MPSKFDIMPLLGLLQCGAFYTRIKNITKLSEHRDLDVAWQTRLRRRHVRGRVHIRTALLVRHHRCQHSPPLNKVKVWCF